MSSGCATSSLVISESYSWFLHRLSEDHARVFRLLLADLEGLLVLDPDERHREKVGHKLDALRGRKLTWVDASSLVWLDELKIPCVWGTDHHLGIGGATVLPGPPKG